MSSSSLQKKFLSVKEKELVNEYQTGFIKHQPMEKVGEKLALSLFHQVAQRVPAYKKWLKKNKIDPTKIKNIKDFQSLPIVTKKNYLRAYPLNELCWDGKVSDLYILSSSSGSTGNPFLWPRGEEQELEGGLNFEVIFKEFFQADKYSTLLINSFSMGTWIAGPFVLACAEYLAKKGYPILTVTPGLDKEVAFSLFKNLAEYFDQIVISGYPPYIKDILDTGKSHGINWSKYQIKLLFAAEGFSEKWREHVHEIIGAKDDFKTSINIYGSADAAILSHETPVTTLIRKLVSENFDSMKKVFGDNRIPTLTQYDPRLKYFEVVNDSIIFTTRSGIPLIRYEIGDSGGVYSFQAMDQKLSELGINLKDESRKFNLQNSLWRLPFVYVFGRSDFTVSFYGLLIYPEHIKYGLESDKYLKKFLTGKFVVSVEFDKDQDPYLMLRVELLENVNPSEILKEKVKRSVVKGLTKVNSEYTRLHEVLKDRALPVIELIKNSDNLYFRQGTKQKWVKK